MISMNPWFAMCIERKIYIDIGVCGPSARARTHTHTVYIIYCISYLLLNIINCPQTWWLKTIKFIIPQFLWTRNWMRLSWVLLTLCLSQGFNQTMGGGCSLTRRKSTGEDPFPAPSLGCWQDPFPLKDCGPSTSLSFLPCEPLHKVPHNMVGDLHQRGEHRVTEDRSHGLFITSYLK